MMPEHSRRFALMITASLLTAVIVMSCSQADDKGSDRRPTAERIATQTPAGTSSPAATASAAPTAAPAVSRVKSFPPEGGDRPTAAEFKGYTYSYTTDGKKTDAVFGPKLLPEDRDIVFGAIRDVIQRSYGEKLDSDPHLTGTGAAQTIRITGKKHQYVVVPINEPTGEIHSLIITQLD